MEFAPNHGLPRLRCPLALVFALACLSLALPGAAQTGDEIVNTIGMRFAPIPRTVFEMGSPEDQPHRGNDETLHEVQISNSYYFGVFEVTQRQYEQVMETNPSYFSANGPGRGRIRVKEAPLHPVEGVSWNDAFAFCKKLGDMEDEKERKFTYRLPTEAEWEWACRAGTSTALYVGNNASSNDANFNGIGPLGKGPIGPFLRRTWPIGGYKANAFGLYDMHGNVAEWCSDWYAADAYKKSPKVDPQGPRDGQEKVVRGGSWSNSARYCRSATRQHLPPETASYGVGFRVVLMRGE